MSKSFRDRIQTMNAMYKLPIHEALPRSLHFIRQSKPRR
jgi:hypothetical protein